jgi:hypothetical protein
MTVFLRRDRRRNPFVWCTMKMLGKAYRGKSWVGITDIGTFQILVIISDLEISSKKGSQMTKIKVTIAALAFCSFIL